MIDEIMNCCNNKFLAVIPTFGYVSWFCRNELHSMYSSSFCRSTDIIFTLSVFVSSYIPVSTLLFFVQWEEGTCRGLLVSTFFVLPCHSFGQLK